MSGPKRPIKPVEYLCFKEPIDLGEYRVSRGITRVPHSACPHKKLTFDREERRVWCLDCENDVDSFDAFTSLVEGYNNRMNLLREEQESVKEVMQFQVRRVATKKLDEIWRSRGMVPICPHCSRGLLPEDFSNPASMSSSLEKKRRENRT